MTNLTRLRVADSDLSSPIPQALCTLKLLWMLDLSANYLGAELPQCLSNLTSLQSLSASGNRFSGDISLSPLPALLSLKEIDISDNQFRIPISLFPFFNHSRLQYFYGGYNQEIYGDDHLDMVLQQGALLFQLRDLELYQQPGYGGGYVGSFPKFLYHQTKLESVCITNVNITGVAAGFPWWLLTNNTHLEFLYLSNCSLSGHFQIPIHQQQQYPPHENLRELYISTNEFFPGPIPPDICAFFPNLDYLSLSDNKFYGEIPSHYLSNCSSFRLLDARNNQLSGEIPRWIWNMSANSIIDLSKNKFSGHLPPGFISPLMKEVYLSRNQLEGTLPATLSDNQDGMSGADNYTNYLIGVLDLSHNRLMGTIPKWIG
ncbi:unnamed protein product [Linum tenue]|uniref:Uncharacterized protein n=1 Tax=Linum tenue TaxID=586396 RepID=A0AAV0HTX7_9ROSI|nr:unnamed protein product [Linum tenue]